MAWNSIYCPLAELNLKVLGIGQSFRWKMIDDRIWQGVARNRVWQLYRNEEKLFYKILANFDQTDQTPDIDALTDYFQLNINLSDLYKQWTTQSDGEHFRQVAEKMPGMRLLRQDPVECLFSFICSSNNNIKRISSMVDKLCIHFGQSVSFDGQIAYNFPTIQQLTSSDIDEKLRKLNFGYRARYIAEAASKLSELIDTCHVDLHLLNLRNRPTEECRKFLTQLTGVGVKVADCTMLMSMDKFDVVPVDTHVLKLTAQHYLPELRKAKTATDKIHKLVGNFYRDRFGQYAGWAQAVLFANEV